jgi:hypothetical protein
MATSRAQASTYVLNTNGYVVNTVDQTIWCNVPAQTGSIAGSATGGTINTYTAATIAANGYKPLICSIDAGLLKCTNSQGFKEFLVYTGPWATGQINFVTNVPVYPNYFGETLSVTYV